MPVARPSEMFDWGGIPIEPTAPQKASGFAISQNVPAEALNWLLQNVEAWLRYSVDYIDTTYAAAKAQADAQAGLGAVYPVRTLMSLASMVFASVSAAVDSNGALQHVLAVGAAGKTLRYDLTTQAATSSTWGLATDCNDIAYGNSRHVACGATGKVRTSTDGSAWSAYHDLGGTSALASIAFSADKTLFCAGGTDSGGTNGTTVTGNGVAAATVRALPTASDVPRRVIWVGGSVQAFFVFTTTAVYSSPDPTTTPFTQIATYGAFSTVLDACWHPTLGIIVLGVVGGNLLRYVWSQTGAPGSWISVQGTITAASFAGGLLAVPGNVLALVTYGSGYTSAVFPLAYNFQPDPLAGGAEARSLFNGRITRAKVLHNSIYLAAMTNATDGAALIGPPLDLLRSYSRG